MQLKSLTKKIQHFYTRNRLLVRILIYCLWAVLFGSILWAAWNSRDQLLPHLYNANWKTLPSVIGFYILALFLSTANWVAIIACFTDSIPLMTHVKIYLMTLVARRLPGTIWYIGGRIVLYKKQGISEFQTASASGIELIVSLAADCFLAGIFLPFSFNFNNFWLIPIIAITLASLTILHPYFIAQLMKWMNKPLIKPIKLSQVASWFLLRIGLILVGGLMIFQTIQIFFPINSSMLTMVLAARALSGAAGLLTLLLPSSFGASDITIIALLSTIVPPSLATAIALFVRFYTSFFELVFGVVFFYLFRI